MMDTPQADDPGDELVVIQRYHDEGDARLARAELETNGIRAVVFDDSVSAWWHVYSTIGGIGLMVHKENAARAMEVLELQPISDEELAKETMKPVISKCPNCGSSNIWAGNPPAWRPYTPPCCVLAPFAVMALVLPRATVNYLCENCGHAWGLMERGKRVK